MSKSKFFDLNWRDLFRGLVVTVFTGFLTAVLEILQSQKLPTSLQIKAAAISAATAGVAYLLKNLLTNSKDQFGSREPPTTTDQKTGTQPQDALKDTQKADSSGQPGARDRGKSSAQDGPLP
jgi:ABC-type uncharacterized transport system permease subunit